MTIREIPIEALFGDVVVGSVKHGVHTKIRFVSGRWLVLTDSSREHEPPWVQHSAIAYERTSESI
jgi:hypothetical protein